MFEAIQNTYPKVQGNEPVSTNAVPLRPNPAPTEQQQSQKRQAAVAEQEVTQNLLDRLSDDIAAMHSIDLQFSVQEKSGRTVIKVMDKANSEVIREIPSKTVQALAAKIDEVLGLLFDKKV
jgi:flagellar protein FlaG